MDGTQDTTTPKTTAGITRTSRHLRCQLTPDEVTRVRAEVVTLAVASSTATQAFESLKERQKIDLKEAESTAKAAVAKLNARANVADSGLEYRDVDCTRRVDWIARKTTTTRDDTGEVLDERAATYEEVAACGTWERDMPNGRLVLRAPDGAVLDERPLTDAERQLSLSEAAAQKTTRLWIGVKAWDAMPGPEMETMDKPDPKGPDLDWTEQGDWMRCDVPGSLLDAVKHHAAVFGVPVFEGDDAPTVAGIAAGTTVPVAGGESVAEKPAKPAKGGKKKG